MMNTVVSSNRSIFSDCKNKKSSRKNNRMFSRSSDQNISPSNMIYHGILQSPAPAPPSSLYFSYPPPNPIRKQQPPLLPLPFPKPINNRGGRGVSCPPMNGKNGIRVKQEIIKKAVIGHDTAPTSMEPLGPDPNELPRNVKGVMFSGSAIFSLSPPPSSLPLPNFFRRPKLTSCNVEAAGGVNLGATDNLRRLLRLQ